MKIGIIGAGDVGQTLAKLWIQAGHWSFSVHAIPKLSALLFRSWGVLRKQGRGFRFYYWQLTTGLWMKQALKLPLTLMAKS